MGKGKRGGKRGGGSHRDDKQSGGDWFAFDAENTTNHRFEAYYKAQKIVPEDEWDAFMASLKNELPTTFRVTGSRAHAETISNLIKETYVPTMQAVEHEGTTYGPPEQIPWYPEGLAWQLSAPKRIVRKSEPFKVFQRFLVGETEIGNLSRQEAVSMIPPLLLDVEPHHICLDMCAAPGSKTAQILEALNPHHTNSSGLLVANDADYKRTHMLVHQTARMPSKGLIVTNCDASLFPSIKTGEKDDLRFDRILADVPCSGDGTLRKNFEIWKKWGASDANGLHTLQLRILKRAMELLKPGGRMVYSTCSFNPVENEAVIAAAIKSRSDFSIVDASSHLPNLKRRPGITSWKVAFHAHASGAATRGDATPITEDSASATEATTAAAVDKAQLKWYDSYEAYQKDPLPDRSANATGDPWKVVQDTLWAPADVAELGLEKTMRLLPHDQNTGGFFVCVLEKAATPSTGTGIKRALSPSATEDRDAKKEKVETTDDGAPAAVPASASGAPAQAASASNGKGKSNARSIKGRPTKKEQKDWSYREDPFSFAPADDPELETIIKYFKLKDTFPKETIMVRNEGGQVVRVAYLATPLVKRIVENNPASRIRLIFAGVKGFVRQDSQNRTEIPCKWRIPSEGLPEIVPHLGDDVIIDMGAQGISVLRTLLEHGYPTVDLFPQEVQNWFGLSGENDVMGNIIAKFPATNPEEHGHGQGIPLDLVLPIWKAKASLSLLIDKKEKSMLSLRTFGEDICKPIPGPKHPRADEADKADAGADEGVEDTEGAREEGLLNAGAPAIGQAEEAAAEL